MALHVEPDVARVGRGQQPEAALLLVGEELEQVAVFAPPSQLQLGLVAGAFEGVGVGVRRKPAGQGLRCQVAELLERGDARGDQRLGLRAPQPCDEREVVVVDALLPAHVPEVADPAVARRPAVRLGLVGDRGEEPLADAPVVRLELDHPERLALAEPVLDVHVLDGPAGDPRDLLGVEQQLQHVRRLGAAGELRVDGLVAAVGLPLEEVGEAAPLPVGQVRLVDHVGRAGADRLLGQPLRLVGVEPLVVVGGDPDDRAPLGLEPRQVGGLVLVPLAEDEVAVRRLELRLDDLAARRSERERRQVRAGEVVREIGRGEAQRVVGVQAHT